MKFHDLHCHTNLSSCAKRESSAAAMLAAAKAAGVRVLGFANHLWDSAVPGASGWYAPQNVAHVERLRAEAAALPPEELAGVKIYFGCETEYVGQGRVALTPEHAARFDFVLVPPHHFHMRDFVRSGAVESAPAVAKLMLERFHECCEIPFAFGLAHPFTVLGYKEREDEIMGHIGDAEYAAAFAHAAEKNKSIEVNLCSILHDGVKNGAGFNAEYVRMLTIAREAGCHFHLGSDAHETSRLAPERFLYARDFAAYCKLELADDPLAVAK